MGDYLTVTEIAELMNVSDRTVRNWINSGMLNAYRLGHIFRVKKEDFEAFLSNGKK